MRLIFSPLSRKLSGWEIRQTKMKHISEILREIVEELEETYNSKLK